MQPALRPKQQQAIDELSDPHAGEEWFEDLPDEYRERMTREWRERLARGVAIRNGARWIWGGDILRAGLIFGFGDFMCSHGSPGTWFGAMLAGALVGLGTALIGARTLLCIVIGMPSFILWIRVSRGGWSPLFFFAVFIIGAAFAWHGWRRDDQGVI